MDRKPTMRQLERAALRNPTVAACLDLWRHGELCLEQALIAMAVQLDEQNRRLTDALIVSVVETTRSDVIVKPDLALGPDGRAQV